MSNVLDEFMKRKASGSGDKPKKPEAAASENDGDEEKDYRTYGINRALRPVLMLDVRTLTGERVALAYSYLTSVFFDISGVMVLSFTSHDVHIEGRNLAVIYDGVLAHRVRYVQELNPDYEKDAPENEAFISKIIISAAV